MTRLRALLRHLGIGERRWIPEHDERQAHTRLVRSRLPTHASTATAPGARAGDAEEPDPAERPS